MLRGNSVQSVTTGDQSRSKVWRTPAPPFTPLTLLKRVEASAKSGAVLAHSLRRNAVAPRRFCAFGAIWAPLSPQKRPERLIMTRVVLTPGTISAVARCSRALKSRPRPASATSGACSNPLGSSSSRYSLVASREPHTTISSFARVSHRTAQDETLGSRGEEAKPLRSKSTAITESGDAL